MKASKGNISPNAAVYALNIVRLLARIDFSQARTDTTTTEALADVNAAVDDWKSAAQAQQVLITKQPKKATSNSYATLAQYLYLAGDTKGGDQAAAQAKTVKGAGRQHDRHPAQAGSSSSASSSRRRSSSSPSSSRRPRARRAVARRAAATGGANPLNGLGTAGSAAALAALADRPPFL